MSRFPRDTIQKLVLSLKLQGLPKIGDAWIHSRTQTVYRVVNYSIRAADSKPDVVYTRDDNQDPIRVYWSRDLDDFRKKFIKDNTTILLEDFLTSCKKKN